LAQGEGNHPNFITPESLGIDDKLIKFPHPSQDTFIQQEKDFNSLNGIKKATQDSA